MAKDLEQEFVQGRINKAREEIAKVLEKYQLLLSAEMNYTQGGILPIIKLVDNSKEANKPAEPKEQTPQDKKESK